MNDRYKAFTTLIARINRCIHKIKYEEMSEFGLKGPHVSCLYYLYKSDNKMTAKELADICDEDKAAISRSIDFLENNGYIVCESKTAKRYKSPLSLTEKAKQVGEKIVIKIDNLLEKSSMGVTEEERNIFYKCLSSICENLSDICNDYSNK